ncbi:MAG: transcription antitermination factor NusB [Kiloniellaceae bacterium]
MTQSAHRRSANPTRSRAPGSPKRSAARLAAAQALYQIEMTGAAADRVLREFLDLRLTEEVDGVCLAGADRGMLADLVRGVAGEPGELDDMLSAVLDEDWPVERLETLLRVVLRAGAYELTERRDIPARVIISEYVDLADAFFGGKEPGLVNGVLDRLAHALRPEEFDAEAPTPARSGAG